MINTVFNLFPRQQLIYHNISSDIITTSRIDYAFCVVASLIIKLN